MTGERPIEIVASDPRWPGEFERERARLADALGLLALRIDHVGSTSVPGLAAKPVIDIQISVAALHPIDVYAALLEELGYRHLVHPDDSFSVFLHRPSHWPHTHHIHVVEAGGAEERDVLAFRDFLRDHPDAVRRYEALKRDLAGRYAGSRFESRQAYADAKAPFVREILDLAQAAGRNHAPSGSDSPARRNRFHWNATSDDYQARHGPALERAPLAWGVWRVPEAEVGALGDLEGRAVLELGCGAGQWSVALARSGVSVCGFDLSEGQLRHARRRARSEGVRLALAQGDAAVLPFADGVFDVVFCDHGATTFAQPERVVPEAARVLKPGGRFVFCMSSPLRDVCLEPATDRVGERLVGDYFAMGVVDDGSSVCFQLPYGRWIRLFRGHGLVVEDLVELRAPSDARTTYEGYAEPGWARRWPAENIWVLSRSAD